MTKQPKNNGESLPKPTFDRQLDGYCQDNSNDEDPIFSGAYHKFMVQLLTKRDKAVKNELIRELRKENKKFRDSLLGDVNEVIQKQWIRVLNEKLNAQSVQLNNTMTTIAGDVNLIKQNLQVLEDNQAQDEIEIALLKKIHELPKSFDARLQEVEKLKPDIKELKEYAGRKWTAIRWSTAIAMATLLVLFLMERFPDLIHKIFGR